ncbi:MAG: ABC transporter substrate-binding protein, partial [Candidatus Eremiobacteraeota bacterium]|nr:ABC transporter substrate-binding protein [Candidatus Eremiobacteraeota bacterium]
VQGLTLREAAQQQLGNAHALDQSIVSIDHPSGISALLNGQLAAHLTSPPFQYQEVAAGAHVVLRSFAILGQHTFNSVYVSESFAAAHPEFIKGVYRELVDATDLIKRHPAEAAAILSRDANGKVPASDFEKWLRRGDVNFTTTPHGFLRFASIMKSIDAIKKVPSSMRDIEVMSVLNGAGD